MKCKSVWLFAVILLSAVLPAGTLTFHSGGAAVQGTMPPVTGLEAGTMTLPACTYTRDGYRFVGWVNYDSAGDASLSPVCQDRGTFDFRELSQGHLGTHLYAVWAPEGEVYTITFADCSDPQIENPMRPLYVRKGDTIVIPPLEFELPAGFSCVEYQTDTDGYLRIGGTFRPKQDVVFTPNVVPESGWIGGAHPEHAGRWVMMRNVEPPTDVLLESTIIAGKEVVYRRIPWKPDCGWYDLSQYNYNFCWAGSGAALMHWWFAQNRDYVERYGKYEGPDPEKVDPSGASAIFTRFVSGGWPNEGGYPTWAFHWFLAGDTDDALPDAVRGKAGYLKEVFADKLPTDVVELTSRRIFNDAMTRFLTEGYGIGVAEREVLDHAITFWGAHYDAEGYIDAVMVTDTAGDPTSQKGGGYEDEFVLGGLILDIVYDESSSKPYYVTAGGGRSRVGTLYALGLGTDVWEAYFARRDTMEAPAETMECSQ